MLRHQLMIIIIFMIIINHQYWLRRLTCGGVQEKIWNGWMDVYIWMYIY